jgi:hypothetical protein
MVTARSHSSSARSANIGVNTYELEAYVTGGYYSGSVEDVFVVSDPSLGFTTGGGFFYWPGTELVEDVENTCYPYDGDKTNFSFNFKYNKKRRNVQGSLLVMRHTLTPWPDCEETTYKLKSNSLDGMSLGEGEDSGGSYGWAAVSGKATFRDPNDENTGGNLFLLYVEDHGEQGCGQAPADEFWVEVDAPNAWLDPLGADPAVDEPTSVDDPDAGDDVPIFCGDIVVPHKAGGKGGGDDDGPKKPNPKKSR